MTVILLPAGKAITSMRAILKMLPKQKLFYGEVNRFTFRLDYKRNYACYGK